MKFVNTIYPSLVFLLASIIFSKTLHAQASVVATNNTQMVATGNTQISLNGSWVNQGRFSPDLSTVRFEGMFDQHIENQLGTFFNILVNKTVGEVQAKSDFSLEGTFTINQGDVVLNGQIITLLSSAFLAETPGQTVKGNSGYLTTTRDLGMPTAENIAGMGLSLTTNTNLGNTEIRRGHAEQNGNGTGSILRYFALFPGNQVEPNADIVFAYDESELNNQVEEDLQLFHSDDNGQTWALVNSVVDVNGNTVTASKVSPSGRFTLSSGCLASPVIDQITIPATEVALDELLSFSADFTANCSVTATWNWGDGNSNTGMLSENQASGEHTYTEPGTYTLQLTLTDPSGTQITQQREIIVFDPEDVEELPLMHPAMLLLFGFFIPSVLLLFFRRLDLA